MDATTWVRLQWDRVAAWICVAAGAVVLIIGWFGISRRLYPGQEFPYLLSGGVGGIFLLGLGAMLWLSADLRDEWRKLDRIEAAIIEYGYPAAEQQVPSDGAGERRRPTQRNADVTTGVPATDPATPADVIAGRISNGTQTRGSENSRRARRRAVSTDGGSSARWQA